MTRRWTLLAGAIALSLAAPQAAFATPDPAAASSTADPAAGALRDLRADADGAVSVSRDASGDVALVRSTDGRAMLDSDSSTPKGAVQEQLKDHGDAFGIDGGTSKAVVTQTLDSATGGSVVRADQVVDGVPVFGGQVVMSLDDDQGVVSIASATTDATQVPAPTISEAQARVIALGYTAREHSVTPGSLSATSSGEQLYDPALLHTADPLGARPAWQFEVGNGADIRETVLVGAGRGEIALHFNDAPGLERRICDNQGVRKSSSQTQVPICSSPARTEAGPVSSAADVNEAYDNLGEASQAYSDLDGIDLTERIGASVSGQKWLQSTVGWCYTDVACPLRNAFWDGRQMVFGVGYAGADDVVGHELTHGYVENTSDLFMFHQSGSINESVADTIGEIIDHRNDHSPVPDDDSAWTIGEDLPGGVIRSMQDPTLFGQPDTMTSELFKGDDINTDDGDVHDNDGVGNKTAYLISQGGTFNGHTITGIDGGDATLAKTGRLYLETIPRLTSGAEYADLGRVLVSTCDELAADGTGGFSSTDCDAVSESVAATELSSAPDNASAAAAEVAVSCPDSGTVNTELARDDDDSDGFAFTSTSPLWGRAPGGGVPAYAESGEESLFALDPIPDLGDPKSGTVTSRAFTIPATSGGTYLNFHHAYVTDFDGGTYYDGGQVIVSRLVNGAWVPVSGLPWVNGPTRHIVGSTSRGFSGFGGDSMGYGSSQVDLSSLAGQRVQVAFRIEGDAQYALYGWWIDDIRLYACDTAAVGPPDPVAASAPVSASVASRTTSAVVSWQPPADPGTSPVTSYRITRSDGRVNTASAGKRSLTLTGLRPNTNLSVRVAAVTGVGVGATRSVPIYATAARVTSVAKAKKNRYFLVTGTLTRRGTASRVAGVRLTLQRHLLGRPVWHTVASATSNSRGAKAWKVKQARATYYRVIATGTRSWLGTTSATRGVGIRR